jgi:hypothetical protein
MKKVWSQKDSAYLNVKEQQYKAVSATVTSIIQTKQASVLLQMVLYDASNGQSIDGYQLSSLESWPNEYSSYSGDSRALTLSCPSVNGIYAIFSMDSSLLDDAVDDLRGQFWNGIQQVGNY